MCYLILFDVIGFQEKVDEMEVGKIIVEMILRISFGILCFVVQFLGVFVLQIDFFYNLFCVFVLFLFIFIVSIIYRGIFVIIVFWEFKVSLIIYRKLVFNK